MDILSKAVSSVLLKKNLITVLIFYSLHAEWCHNYTVKENHLQENSM